MSGRVLVLVIGAALLLAMGLYLFVEIRATPPAAPVPTGEHRPAVARPSAAEAPPAKTPAEQPRLPRGDKRMPSEEDRAAVDSDVATKPSGTPGIDGKLDSVMQQANRAYDRGDLDEAKMIATRVLAAQPTNVRMLRILVSSACIDGDNATATANFAKLPPADQEQMRARCARYGTNL